jgi:alpha-L-fucosidase
VERHPPLHWQTDTSLSNGSWGYIQNDAYKTPKFIIHLLADIVSKNGNLLLNVGPRSDGTIPEEAEQILHEVGAWLKVNGEAIYGTRPWKLYGEGPTKVAGGAFHETDTKPYTAEDFRFTAKGSTLYSIGLGWLVSSLAMIRNLGAATIGGQKIQDGFSARFRCSNRMAATTRRVEGSTSATAIQQIRIRVAYST